MYGASLLSRCLYQLDRNVSSRIDSFICRRITWLSGKPEWHKRIEWEVKQQWISRIFTTLTSVSRLLLKVWLPCSFMGFSCISKHATPSSGDCASLVTLVSRDCTLKSRREQQGLGEWMNDSSTVPQYLKNLKVAQSGIWPKPLEENKEIFKMLEIAQSSWVKSLGWGWILTLQ